MKILNLIFWPLLLPILLLVYLIWPKSRPHFSERLGLGRVRITSRGVVLFHVASLGEARAARPLIDALSGRFPLILTTMTDTGREALRKAHPEIPVTLAPLDLPGIWIPFLKSRNVRAILLFETEIWPSMLTSAKDLNLPVGLVNGRLSSKSFTWYWRARFLVRPFLKRLAVVTVQSSRDQERFKMLGVSEKALVVTGNLKWDITCDVLSVDRAEGALKWLEEGEKDLDQESPIRILGSSIHPGEARALLSACRHLAKGGRAVSLILAPRHLEILPEFMAEPSASVRIFMRTKIAKTMNTASESSNADPSLSLFILNTYGELGAITALADIVFVGGTLDPVGGHSPIEAAFHGKPLIWGPHRDHIADLSEGLIESGAAVEVSNQKDLEEILETLRDNPQKRTRMGQASRRVFESCQGPLERTLRVLSPALESLFSEGK